MRKRYRKNRVFSNENGKSYFGNQVYPDIPLSEDDYYVITTVGDRYDILAQQFYGDSSLWWIIVAANNNTSRDSLIPTPGIQLRIPANKEYILNLYENFNSTR